MRRFFDRCECTLQEEINDYNSAVNEILSKPAFVSLMPSVIFDLWPLYVLECTNAKGRLMHANCNHVCFITIGARDFFNQSYFVKMVEAFYRDEEMTTYERLWYDADLEEMILLKSKDCTKTIHVDNIGDINAVYTRFRFPDGKDLHLFVLLETAHGCWQNIFRKYQIKCDILIDSHKGLGDWLETTDLFDAFMEDCFDPILPEYYFKGKYISHTPPEGFTLLYEVPESRRSECVSEIYKAKWG